MATSKVGALPPPSSRANLSRCGPSSSKGRLNGMRDTDSLVVKSSSLQLPSNHWMLQASLFLPPEHAFSAKLCQNGGTVDCDCLMCMHDGAKTVHRGLFSFFVSSLPQQSWMGSVMFVPSYTSLKCEPHPMPTCSHFDASCLRRPLKSDSQTCEQASRQHTPCHSTGFTVTETTADGMNSMIPCVTSLPGEGAGSEKCSDIISRSHCDEIANSYKGIHAPGNRIHADGDSDYSDSERCDDNDYDKKGHNTNFSTPKSGPPVCDKAHLGVNQTHPQLKKLLSDESGYYENVSSDFAVSPCDWSQKAVLLTAEDIEEWEDEDSTGDEGEADDEAADLLWKSFEDCVLSPQTLHMKPTSTDADTRTRITADASSEGDESMMQFGIPDCLRTALYKESQPKHNTHVELHADIPLHKGETVVTTDSSPCRQVLFDHVTTKDIQSIKQVRVDATSQATAHFHAATSPHAGKRVQLDDVAPGSLPKACLHHPRKQVRFPSDSSISVVHEIVAWNYAYRAARKGPWELYARNRAHFRRKIDQLALVIEPCLAKKLASHISH